jgi:cob(I)alamin adenosyltransferase
MKIYTKAGDGGKTYLGEGEIKKTSVKISALGAIDELNSILGIIVAQDPPKEIAKVCLRIQTELFVLGGQLAGGKRKFSKSFVARLEKEIDRWQKNLPKLTTFIIPGGSLTASYLHLARTACRQAEIETTRLSDEEKVDKNALAYLNRLSDWLFVLARYTNKLEGIKENLWKK